jgi:hypothetical protein
MLFKIIFLLFLCLSQAVYAESELNVAKTVQNPLSINPETKYFALPFVNYANFVNGAEHRTQDELDLKPVMPFRYVNGLGDINPTLFVTPAGTSVVNWGLGPTMIMPTATNHALGAGKWSVGPELVLIAMPSRWTFALLTDNVWSIAGQSNRVPVSEFTFQYFITYNFPHGVYVTAQPQITSNWHAVPSQQWTVPFGGGVGRVFAIGSQNMNVLLQGYYDAIRPKDATHWYIQATFEFLFKDKGTLG